MKLGKFTVSSEQLRSPMLAEILASMLFTPFKVENITVGLEYNENVMMTGTSEKFEDIKKGEVIPFYKIKATYLHNKSNNISVKANKINVPIEYLEHSTIVEFLSNV